MAKQFQKTEPATIPPDIAAATAQYVTAAKTAEQASRAALAAKHACDEAQQKHQRAAAAAEDLKKKMIAVIHEAHEIQT